MFNEATCRKCGLCLSNCPLIDLPVKESKLEMERMIQTGSLGDIRKKCVGCAYCDEICPTVSNPSHLRKAIIQEQSRQRGVAGLSMIREEVPFNLMAMALQSDREEKEKRLETMTHPPESDTVFYLGCSLSYLYTDFIDTRLFDEFPKIGGMKYCCGNYLDRYFGEAETALRGRRLLDLFDQTGIKKLITFCPDCDRMLQDVYPSLLDDFRIDVQPVFQYLLERFDSEQLKPSRLLKKKVAFQDSCGWRTLDTEIYEGPRKLLNRIGAEVVEMKHNRKQSMCCAVHLTGKNPALAETVMAKRVKEAKEAGAEIIATSCTGCLSLNRVAEKEDIEVYGITELVQLAINEKPPHRLKEITDNLYRTMFETYSEQPELLKKRYRVENNRVVQVKGNSTDGHNL